MDWWTWSLWSLRRKKEPLLAFRENELSIELKCELMIDDCAKILVWGDLFRYVLVNGEWGYSGVSVVEVNSHLLGTKFIIHSEPQATFSTASASGVCICLALIQGHRFINLAAECLPWHTVLGESRLLCCGDPGQLPWGGSRKHSPRPALLLPSARPTNKTPSTVLHLACGRSGWWSTHNRVGCRVEAPANVMQISK